MSIVCLFFNCIIKNKLLEKKDKNKEKIEFNKDKIW